MPLGKSATLPRGRGSRSVALGGTLASTCALRVIVAPHLEAWRPSGPEMVPLASDRLTIGKHSSNDLALASDPTVSRLHAVVERFPSGWVLRDVGSRNGTIVNGERILRERLLRPGDEIRIGETRLVFRPDQLGPRDDTSTRAAARSPELTRRERDVLLELCRPILDRDLFTEPASIRDLAQALVVSEAAVKQHLGNLYEKFGIDGASGRRVRLANEAVRTGAVSLADLREHPQNP